MAANFLHDWRIFVYKNSLYSEPLYKVDFSRDISPSVFSSRPQEAQRAITWMIIDITVLRAMFTRCTDNEETERICSMIVDLMQQISIESDEFRSILAPFMHQHTRLFCHELLSFLRSPYTHAIAYQCNVQYRCPVGVARPSTSRAVLPDIDKIFSFALFMEPTANHMMSRTNKRQIDQDQDQDELADSQGPAKKFK